MNSETVAASDDQLSPATLETEQRRHHHRGTTWVALLVAGLAVVLYSLGSSQELVTRRLSVLLGRASRAEVVGQRAEPNGLEDFPALPPLADRRRLWPPAIGRLNARAPIGFPAKNAMLEDRLTVDIRISISNWCLPLGRRGTDLQAENLRECLSCLLRDAYRPGRAP